MGDAPEEADVLLLESEAFAGEDEEEEDFLVNSSLNAPSSSKNGAIQDPVKEADNRSQNEEKVTVTTESAQRGLEQDILSAWLNHSWL